MNPLNDISSVYLEEVLKPQLGKSSSSPAPSAAPEKKASADSGPGDAGVKRIRQAVYDIRYRARREDIPLPQAYSQYMSHTSMNAVEKNAVRDKLGMGPGGGSSVKEEVTQKKYQVRVTPKKGFGNPYVRYASDSKIAQLRLNPQISSVEKTKYGTPYEGEKEKGEQTAAALQHKPGEKKAKKDYDRDGKLETPKQEWKGSRDNAIKKAMGVRKESTEVPTGDLKTLAKKASKRVDSNVSGFVNGDDSSDKTMGVFIPSPDGKKKIYGTRLKEGFSDWRTDLSEVVDDDILAKSQKEIKEKKVSNKVTINPQLGEEVQLLESVELSEEYIVESANTAAGYFCEQGLNEFGVDILIEELGLDEFVNFVFDINNEIISEARAGGVKVEPVTKGGKSIGSLKGGAKTAAIKRLRKEKETRREAESKASASKPSGMKSALQRQSAVASAKQQQPKKKGVLDRVAGAVLKGMERHRKAMDLAKETGKTVAKAAKVGAKGASEFGKGVRSGVTGTVTAAKKANKVLNAGYEVDGEILDEKAVSQNQQQLAGMALKYLDGDMPDASDAVKQMAKMGRTELRKFAKTKHKGLPEVKEAIVDQPGSADNQVRDTQDDTVRRQQLKKKEELLRKQQALERQRMMLQKAGRLPVNSGYEPDGEIIDERRKEDKGTPRPPEPSAAFKAVSAMMGSSRAGVQPRGKKKVPGKKPPKAGEYGSERKSPEQIIKSRRASAQRAQDNMSSRFD
jgi:hypothetical protein